MPDLALDLRYLRYALLVAEHGSFRRAADAVGMSQSTVSRRVQLLERRLGVPLFTRSRTGAKLTV
ncbi:helix-turn-helix domain-containing protein, partial [Agrobacterium pusense]